MQFKRTTLCLRKTNLLKLRLGLLKNYPFHVLDLVFLLSDSTFTPTLVIAIASSVFVILCIAVLAFLLSRSLKRKREPSVEQRDDNPVYDMYYFADGQHVDYGTSEVQDENQYYGS